MTAGCLLVREAGGHFCDFTGQSGMPAGGNLIAANHLLAAAMVGTIGPVLPAELR